MSDRELAEGLEVVLERPQQVRVVAQGPTPSCIKPSSVTVNWTVEACGFLSLVGREHDRVLGSGGQRKCSHTSRGCRPPTRSASGEFLHFSPAHFDIRLGHWGEEWTLASGEQAWSVVRMDELRVRAPEHGLVLLGSRLFPRTAGRLGFVKGPPIGHVRYGGIGPAGQPPSRPKDQFALVVRRPRPGRVFKEPPA